MIHNIKTIFIFIWGKVKYHRHHGFSPSMSEQHIEAIHKISEALMKALQQVHTITGQYIKVINDDKKQKEKQRPPKVHYDREALNAENKLQPTPAVANDRAKIPEAKLDLLVYGKLSENMNTKTLPRIVAQQSRQTNPSPIRKHDNNGKNQQKQIRPPSKKPAHPERPKMPVSAFLLFNRDYAGKVRKQYPHLTQTDLVTVTGNLWKQLSDQDKKPFDDQYRRQKIRYDAEMLQFYRKFPAEKSKKQIKLQRSLGNG